MMGLKGSLEFILRTHPHLMEASLEIESEEELRPM
jgi:hypothetical protein